jgi:hypothetical protein
LLAPSSTTRATGPAELTDDETEGNAVDDASAAAMIDWFNVFEAIFWFAFAPLSALALRGALPGASESSSR